jgi:hypothetical protein
MSGRKCSCNTALCNGANYYFNYGAATTPLRTLTTTSMAVVGGNSGAGSSTTPAAHRCYSCTYNNSTQSDTENCLSPNAHTGTCTGDYCATVATTDGGKHAIALAQIFLCFSAMVMLVTRFVQRICAQCSNEVRQQTVGRLFRGRPVTISHVACPSHIEEYYDKVITFI